MQMTRSAILDTGGTRTKQSRSNWQKRKSGDEKRKKSGKGKKKKNNADSCECLLHLFYFRCSQKYSGLKKKKKPLPPQEVHSRCSSNFYP
jgi:hypothetical protein